MPSKDSHLQTARDNRATCLLLLDSDPQSQAWATTIAFYCALHLVEAALAVEGRHSEDHMVRNMHLKTTRKLQNIWRNYKPLYDNSLKARYLTTDSDSAETLVREFLGEDKVREKIIGHYLRQVEKSVAKIIGEDSIF